MNNSPDHILQVGFAFWGSKVLLSAVEMELFTELAKHPGDLGTIQGRMGLHPRGAQDFLDALVALGFLLRDEKGVYSNTPDTEAFLDKAKPSYIGGIMEMANHPLANFVLQKFISATHSKEQVKCHRALIMLCSLNGKRLLVLFS